LYVILSQYHEREEVHEKYKKFASVPEGFAYRSNTNESWLTTEKLRSMLE